MKHGLRHDPCPLCHSFVLSMSGMRVPRTLYHPTSSVFCLSMYCYTTLFVLPSITSYQSLFVLPIRPSPDLTPCTPWILLFRTVRGWKSEDVHVPNSGRTGKTEFETWESTQGTEWDQDGDVCPPVPPVHCELVSSIVSLVHENLTWSTSHRRPHTRNSPWLFSSNPSSVGT